MHPPFSVIFLTTLIGVAQGLFVALVLGQWLSAPSTVANTFYINGSIVVLALLGLGLIASFFHLGRPERFWRTATMWKTSWLSREVIALPAFMGAVAAYGALHYYDWDMPLISVADQPLMLSLVTGFVACGFAFLLFFCTGMIYASVRFLQEWASSLTVINFTLLGLASGFTLAALLAKMQAESLVGLYAVLAVFLTLLATLTRSLSLYRNAKLKPISTLKTAIGIRHSKIRQITQGAMGGSFNTREYQHHQTQQMVKMIKWFFLVAVFLLPVALLVIGLSYSMLMAFLLAVCVQYVGLIAERWFFFAQANHPQNIYYQAT